MNVSDGISDFYDNYYDLDGRVARKRVIAARQTCEHLRAVLPGRGYGRLLDVGAGEGAVLAELDAGAFAIDLYAVEISRSGVDAIKRRCIPRLRSVCQFNGYEIDSVDKSYDIGTAIHVLEHVEHERLFIKEITRVCDLVYIEVPLELTAYVGRSIKLSGPYGHINFYNPITFKNLLATCGVEILEFKIFQNSMSYERHVGGNFRGSIRYAFRSVMLATAPSVATSLTTYLAAVVCRRF